MELITAVALTAAPSIGVPGAFCRSRAACYLVVRQVLDAGAAGVAASGISGGLQVKN